MPVLRKDPVVKRWVIIKDDQPFKLSQLQVEDTTPKGDTSKCPFCPGHEEMTPPEVLAYRSKDSEPNKEGWEVRVIPNKFAALKNEGELNRKLFGVYDKMNGVGAHEVIIETPEHFESFYTYPVSKVEQIIWAFVDRYDDLRKDKRLRYIQIFKNHGKAAGASLEHPHCQIIATPVVVKRVMEEIDGSKEYYIYHDSCLFCDMIDQEIAEGIRVIEKNSHFVAFCPFASRFPFEIWVLPLKHRADFGHISEEEVRSLAEIMSNVFKRLGRALSNPPYNFIIHTSPVNSPGIDCSKFYHWHIEIMPRVIKTAGFEWASGFYTNPLSPEEAAKLLRNA